MSLTRSALAGTRIRERRLTLGIKQADLAQDAGISPSYLNLIEHNRRRIGGALLGRIARALSVDVSALTRGAEAAQIDILSEAAATHEDVAPEADRIDELVGRFPGWSRVIAAQRRRIDGLEDRVAGLTDRLAHDPYLAASLHEILSKVAAIRSTASILAETDDLDANWLRRFHRNLGSDSDTLADRAAALAGYLDADGAGEAATLSPQEELEAFLDRHDHRFAALERADVADGEALIARLIDDPALASVAARARAIDHLRTYLADARALPLPAFAETAARTEYDPARLATAFGTSISAVLRRFATLPLPPGDVPVGLVRCDGSGALTLRKPTELLPMPRFGTACALWPLYEALARPSVPIRGTLASAARPDRPFTVWAVCDLGFPGGTDGAVLRCATMAILPDTLTAPDAADRARPVGSACRVCVLRDCPARREPSLVADGFDTGGGLVQ